MRTFKYINILILLLLPFIASAQQTEMADGFRKDGKIYVVLAVIAVILTGIFIYLFMLDKKINKIEKEINKQ